MRPQPQELRVVEPLLQVGGRGRFLQDELVGLFPLVGVGDVVDRPCGGVQVQRQLLAAAHRSPQRGEVGGHHDLAQPVPHSPYPVPGIGPELV